MGEIIIYSPADTIKIEVRLGLETVWLTQSQLGVLFDVDRTAIVRHIGNIYRTRELDEDSTCARIAQVQNEGGRMVERIQKYYNLDMILSVGYRVNSRNATSFRRWANSVLKEFLLRGYAINPRLEQLEQRVAKTEQKIDFFVRTALPPVEGIFYDGQIFDAYEFASKLIKSAKKEIVLIDNYIDETVLTLLDKRTPSVKATIYTKQLSAQFQLDLNKHNAQYPFIDVHALKIARHLLLCCIIHPNSAPTIIAHYLTGFFVECNPPQCATITLWTCIIVSIQNTEGRTFYDCDRYHCGV